MAPRRVLIAGAGPVGLTLALLLARRGVPVVVFEACPGLNSSSQASTFHGSTLDLLDELGVAWRLIEVGHPTQRLQYRDRDQGLVAEFDVGLLRDVTRFPIRLQADQSELTRLILAELANHPSAEVRFGSRVVHARSEPEGAMLEVETAGGREAWRGVLAVGTDGAHSAVRKALGIAFEGSIYALKHLMITTSYNVLAHMPELAPVTYVFDQRETVAVLTLRWVWRVVFMVPNEEPDEAALAPESVQRRLRGFLPAQPHPYPVIDARIATLHQRVAGRFRDGSVLLAGDAAHLNHPLGGMGLNSGIHDAYVLGQAICRVWSGDGGPDPLEDYATSRRRLMLDKVIPAAERYQRESDKGDQESRERRNELLRAIAADPDRAREWLIEASMYDTAPRPAGLPSGARHS